MAVTQYISGVKKNISQKNRTAKIQSACCLYTLLPHIQELLLLLKRPSLSRLLSLFLLGFHAKIAYYATTFLRTAHEFFELLSILYFSAADARMIEYERTPTYTHTYMYTCTYSIFACTYV